MVPRRAYNTERGSEHLSSMTIDCSLSLIQSISDVIRPEELRLA
jgi:hypothetical protein